MRSRRSDIPEEVPRFRWAPATSTSTGEKPTDEEVLWAQFRVHIDLYKTYLEALLKFNVFFYGITGGIVAFVLSRPDETSLLRFALLLPVVMSFGFSCLGAYGAITLKPVAVEVKRLASRLRFATYPNVDLLAGVLWLCSLILFGVSVALTILFFWW